MKHAKHSTQHMLFFIFSTLLLPVLTKYFFYISLITTSVLIKISYYWNPDNWIPAVLTLMGVLWWCVSMLLCGVSLKSKNWIAASIWICSLLIKSIKNGLKRPQWMWKQEIRGQNVLSTYHFYALHVLSLLLSPWSWESDNSITVFYLDTGC